ESADSRSTQSRDPVRFCSRGTVCGMPFVSSGRRPARPGKEDMMGLTLYYHPLASYCWKVLIALYENGTPFEAKIVDLMDAAEAKAFRQFSPMGKMPALHDGSRGRTIIETSVVIEYLDRHYPGPTRFLPDDP